MPTSRVMSSPFLPNVPALADEFGRVKFPATRSDGLLTLTDRDPKANRPTVYGPTSYTKPPTAQRVGGPFRVRIGNL